MSLFEDTNPHDLKELLGQIHKRESALPDFQRDFVWEPVATQELLVSIASDYPAGSLLRIRNVNNLFACREFQGSPPLNSSKPTYLFLDGQQRLTSLYQAFYGVGEHRYYLDLRGLLSDKDFEECIFHLRATSKRAQEYAKFEVQARDLILPLSVLKDGGEFGDWIFDVTQTASTADEGKQMQQALRTIDKKWIKTIDDYKFPVVTLDQSTSAEAVCTIFETLNRTGVKLSPFELLVARFWPKNVNLRHLWQTAKDKHPIIAEFEIDPYYAVQIVSLAARNTPSCKRGDVLNLTSTDIITWWDRAIDGLSKALEIMRDDCGVATAKWLPYNTIILPFAAVLAKLSGAGSPAVGATRQKLCRWFWCSVYGQAYENAPNSQAAKDVGEIMQWVSGGAPPETVGDFSFDPRTLTDTTPRQRAVYRGAICLILRNNPRDFHTGAKVPGDLIVKNGADDHHIFPQAYLEKQSIASRLRDCVLNRTLIDHLTNSQINDRPPSKYLAEIKAALGPVTFQQLLQSHLLPGDNSSPLLHDQFDAFLKWRQSAIWNEIKVVTGAHDDADTLAEEAAS